MARSLSRLASAKNPPFESEQLLVNGILNFLSQTTGRRFRFFAEHEGGFGRPDLLLFNVSMSATVDIRSLSQINPRFAPLFSLSAATGIRSLADLAGAAGVSINTARRIARELKASGRLIEEAIGAQTFRIIPIIEPPFPQVVAIEAKLRDWRRALVQAYRYREFSSESWVVLDHARIAPAFRARDVFQASGIGLSSFSTDGNLHVHVPAQNREWRNSSLAWRTQAMLARRCSNPPD